MRKLGLTPITATALIAGGSFDTDQSYFCTPWSTRKASA